MRVQVAHPAEHEVIVDLPYRSRLDRWDMPNVHNVLGLHRHVVKMLEYEQISYVVKELPDHLALREYRLLRELDDEGLPTAEVVAAVTGRPSGEGLLITRHLDYSLPYRSLLMGRGLKIPYLGERVLDALVVLLVRIHLAGFFWGDCSLSNTLFRRDAGALQAYIIDMETAERHDRLTDGQRSFDLEIATQNVAGGLLDLQAAGQLAQDIDPIEVALAIADRYHSLWNELLSESTAPIGDAVPMQRRLERLHELGFDVDEMEVITNDDGVTVNFIPKVVEHGYNAEQLANLTGLTAGENQARRMLQDIRSYGAWLQRKSERPIPLNVAAVRWMDRVFEPVMAAIPEDMFERLEAAEIFHQLLEHRWYKSEQTGAEIALLDVLDDYLAVLAEAPQEKVQLDGVAVAEPNPLTADEPGTVSNHE
jgi:tRNA A-37 threonylcarbamoyl transferase component Bud32